MFLLGVTALTLTAALLIVSREVNYSANRYERLLQGAQARGYWTNNRDFATHFEQPKELRSVDTLQKVVSNFRVDLNRTPKSHSDPDVVRLYDRHSQTIGLIDELDLTRPFAWPRDYSVLMFALYPEFSPLRGLAKLLSLRAQVAVDQNDIPTAVLCWRRVAILRAYIRHQATVIADLVNTSCSANACVSFQYALNQRGSDPRWVGAVETALELHDRQHEIRLALNAELATTLDSIRYVFKGPQSRLKDVLRESNDVKQLYALSRLPQMERASSAQILIAHCDALDAIQGQERDMARIKCATSAFDRSLSKGGLSRRFAESISFSAEGWGGAITRDYAKYNVLRSAIRRLKGARTEDRKLLDFDLRPIRELKTDEGFIIYSIGEDKRDDGGDLNPRRPGSEVTKDFGVRIPR